MSKRIGKSFSEAGRLGAIATKNKMTNIWAERKLKIIENYNVDPKKCLNCDKTISFEKRQNKFCSQSCAATKNNFGKCKNTAGNNGVVNPIKNKKGKVLYINCLFCDKQLSNKQQSCRNKFCSSNCDKQNQWEKYKTIIEQNKELPKMNNNSYGYNPKHAKRYLHEACGSKCSVCGLTEWGGKPILLILDHINGNSYDNKISNLRLVCSNCDTLSPHYKGRNKGNGRHMRRLRYQQKKSY